MPDALVLRRNSLIKNIVFDMGDVLMHFLPEVFIDRYDLSPEDKKIVIDKIYFDGPNWSLVDWGYLSEEDYADMLCKEMPEKYHVAVRGMICKWFDPVLPVEGMGDLIKRLKESGYNIYLLSNAGLKHSEYWNKIPGSEYFDGIVVSAYEKAVKPQPEIYKILLDRFRLKADECLFIDNNHLNLAGAHICGIDTVIFKNCKDLTERLKNKGINI